MEQTAERRNYVKVQIHSNVYKSFFRDCNEQIYLENSGLILEKKCILQSSECDRVVQCD